MKHSHIEKFTLKSLIIEWTTVTFCSASLLTNKYREGGSLLWKSAPLHHNSVSFYTQIRVWDLFWSGHKKRIASKKSENKKKISKRKKLLDRLSKLPHTVFLRATALCAVHALAVYDRFQVMSSTFSHLQKPRCQHGSGNEGGNG